MRIIDYVDRSTEQHPDRLLASGGGTACTYAEAQERSHGIAAGLYARGFRLDDGVAVLGRNDPLSLC
ncbi:MAG TPA: hypothetical protein VEA81_10515, partial [Burkholderiaceae bacterium]|nr:hypothetical protein [Burkholderiaceae bacterium]